MTRDEEIRKAAGNVAIRDNKGHYAHGFLMQALREAFTEGARWADSHPHWISVEDELPNFFDIVLYCDEDGDYYTETDNIGEDVKITHWMHIPDCPPLQDFNNKLKAVLDGENEKGGEQ